MATTKKTNAFKSPLAAAKKLNKKQLGILVAILAVIGVGAFYWYKSHAAGYTRIWTGSGIANGYAISACKQYTNTAYGPIYNITIIYSKPASAAGYTARAYTYIGGQYPPTNTVTSKSWWNNTVTSIKILNSIPRNDSFAADILSPAGYSIGGVGTSYKILTDC